MSEGRLYVLQRASAAILAPLTAIHLATIVYAVHGGLTAGEILARTRGSVAWGTFYALFVFAASVHAPIGLRNVAAEWLGWRRRTLDLAALAMGLVLLALGLKAVAAVVLPQ